MEHPFWFWTALKKICSTGNTLQKPAFNEKTRTKVQEILRCGLEELGFLAQSDAALPSLAAGKGQAGVDLRSQELAQTPGKPESSETHELVLALSKLTELLFSWSKKINLTGHSTPEKIASRLILDALALAKQLPAFRSLADLGSGAGFPGLPLAILFPEREFLLVEARERRVHFQKNVIRELGLTNVRSLCGRVEALEPEPCDLVIAQAMADFAQVVAWMKPWCTVGGYIVVPCSADQPEVGDLQDVKRTELRTYRVPIAEIERKVWIAKRER